MRQYQISHFMAVLVVDVFEVVKIAHNETDCLAGSTGPLHFQTESLIKIAEIEKPCQLISAHHLGELLDLCTQTGHFVQMRAILIASRAGSRFSAIC